MTTCRRGHPLTFDSCYFRTQGSFTRLICRTCVRENDGTRTKASTHCRNGHLLQHTYTQPGGRRACRLCRKNRRRRQQNLHALGRTPTRDLIANEALREEALRAIKDDRTTWQDLAVRCGILREHGKGDGARLKRALGVLDNVTTSRAVPHRYSQKQLRRDTAEKITRELGLDPVDVGL